MPAAAARLPHELAAHPAGHWIVGVVLLVSTGAAVVWAWAFYDANLLPYVRVVPAIPARVRVVPRTDSAAVQRLQTVIDLLGEASSDLAAKRPEWARPDLERALALDPGNPDALAMLAQLTTVAAPTLTPTEQADRARAQRVTELLGAATSFLAAERSDAARPLLEEALALDPSNAAVRDQLARLRAPANGASQ